jgi:outer membrane lipoprotein carrier protein
MSRLLLIICFLLPGMPAHAVPRVTQMVSRFEARYRSARTLQATFLERYLESGRLVRTEAGTAYFRRPGKMRWEYESPEKDLFLVDGKTAWFYVPADHTVTRVPAKQSTDLRTPLALLAGEMRVSRVCASVEAAVGEKPEREDHVVLRCILRGAKHQSGGQGANGLGLEDDARHDAVLFEISTDTGELARLLIQQSAGVQIEFKFENWRMDPPLADSLFRFEPPLGVAIVNGELAAGDTNVK